MRLSNFSSFTYKVSELGFETRKCGCRVGSLDHKALPFRLRDSRSVNGFRATCGSFKDTMCQPFKLRFVHCGCLPCLPFKVVY